MPDLDYAKVTGRLALTVGDTADTGEDPDTIWCDEGTVRIKPLNTYTKVAGGSPVPFTAGHAVIDCTVDSEGYLTYLGQRQVYVVDLTSPKVNPQIGAGLATHEVSFLDVKAGGTPVSFEKMEVRLTKLGLAGDGENDITIVSPVPSGSATPIIVGPQGTGIQSLAVEGGDLVVALSDGSEVNAGALPVGPGGSDAGVAGYVLTPGSDTEVALSATIGGAIDAAVLGLDTIVEATLAASDTYVLDPTAGDQFILTLTGDATLSIPTYTNGSRFIVQVIQDPTGGHTLTLPDAIGSITLVTTPDTYEVLVYRGLSIGGSLNLHVTHATAAGPVVLPPWTPAAMVDQIAWYDPNLLADADATEITVLPNQFGNLALVGNGTATTYPTVQTDSGRRVLRFDGTNDQLATGTANGSQADWPDGTQPQPLTIAAVVKVATAKTATQTLLGGRDTTADLQLYTTGSGVGSKWTANSGTALGSGVTDDLTWTTVVVVLTAPGSAKIRVDGVEVAGNAGSEGIDSLRVGANSAAANFMGMDLADLLVVGHAVTGEELTNLEGYLNDIRDTLAGA